MFFSVLTKNLNWEILTKNLLTFPKWYGLRVKNVNIMGVHRKIRFLEGGFAKKTIYRGNCLKMGLGQFADFGGGGGELW